MTEPQPIDRAALARLLEETGGDPDFLGELLDAYFTDTPELLATLEQALATNNAAELRRAAHALKSNSQSFGAQTLAGFCRELEDLGKGGTVDGAAPLLAQVRAEYDVVKGALQEAMATGYTL